MTLSTFALFCALAIAAGSAAADPLVVCATTPDLGSLAREIGGDDVDVTVFARGPEDPHFVEARPSFVRRLSRADVVILVGLDLELGWLPPLLRNARNRRVQPGGDGYLDASLAIEPLEVPAAGTTRSSGDVHRYGNPHYLLDPLDGLRVAALMRDRFGELRPEQRGAFAKRYEALERAVTAALVGKALSERYDARKLARLHELGKLLPFLRDQGELDLLAGWLGEVAAFRGSEAVADHNLWPYFARRFGLEVEAFLEPWPGIPPTTRHLADVVRLVETRGINLILTSPYFDPRHADVVAGRTGARIAAMVHQVDAVPDASDYLAMVDYNVSQLVRALGEDSPRRP